MGYDKTQKEALLEKVEFDKHFQAGSWPEYNRKFFDGLAPKYDALNGVLSLGRHRAWKSDLIQRMPIRPGDSILDLCTGSGDLAIETARRFPSCRIVAADVSEKMLEIARRRAQGISNLTFVHQDALHLKFQAESFEGVLMGFGLRNLDDLEVGFREVLRVLKPGGFFASLDLGKPEGAFRRFVYHLYFEKLMPWLGAIFFHRGEFNSFRYLPESNRFFPSPEELSALMKKNGFSNVRMKHYLWGALTAYLGEKGAC